jgi:hypothetical protein
VIANSPATLRENPPSLEEDDAGLLQSELLVVVADQAGEEVVVAYPNPSVYSQIILSLD